MSESQRQPRPVPFAITLWLLICAAMSNAGWLLSALHQLDARGYTCVILLFAVAVVIWEKSRAFGDLKFARFYFYRLARRFKKPLPLAFLVMSAIALIGGILYAPNNYDALAYRVPRVLHWLAHGQWHWVQTEFPRLNVRACGAEWLMAPIIAFTKNSRWIFLPDVISFLLLPGLLFSVFTRLGVKHKTAWQWMWIFTTGHSLVMQAGGIGNDLPGAVFALAAFDFGLRARESRRWQDVWLFFIAAGLLTGAKASNVLLLLPAAILIFPRLPVLFARPVASVLIMLFAVMASFVPTAVLNWKYCHDWTGMKLEGPMQSPLNQLAVNVANWIVFNFFPPIFPLASQWTHFLSHTLGLSAEDTRCLAVPSVQLGEGDCLGPGVCWLLLAGCVATWLLRRRDGFASPAKPLTPYRKLLLWSPYVALLAFGLKAQTVASSSRLLTPYYAILAAPVLLLWFDERILKRSWWKCLVAIVFAFAIVFEILMPARPLWPAVTVLDKLKASHPASGTIAYADAVYSLYSKRPEAFAPVLRALPPDTKVIGMITFDDPETALWWPLGSRRIEHVTRADTPQTLAARDVKYILAPQYCYAISLRVEDVIHKYDATVIAKIPLTLRVQDGPQNWYILEIKLPPDAN